jgi:hypothetical protein
MSRWWERFPSCLRFEWTVFQFGQHIAKSLRTNPFFVVWKSHKSLKKAQPTCECVRMPTCGIYQAMGGLPYLVNKSLMASLSND